jgi:hypothetical protein
MPEVHPRATGTVNPLPELRRGARQAYEAGRFDEAVHLQREAIALASRQSARQSKDYLLLALYNFVRGEFAPSLAILKEAEAYWPASAEIVENIGVLLNRLGRWQEGRAASERALSLGSKSTNVLDGLCESCGKLGDVPAMQRYGRLSLERKNETALRQGQRHALPADPPPPFDPTNRRANVISYGLWGSSEKYIRPLLENVRIAPHVFPGWTIRVHVDSSVPTEAIQLLKHGKAEIVDRSGASAKFYERLLWRFEVANDAHVQRFLVRDADSLLTVKERVAVDAWLKSACRFHLMRDFFTHTDLVLAGMWGGTGGILPDLKELWASYKVNTHGPSSDQKFLGAKVWPTISQSCLIHDSVFVGCLGSVDFPPFGALPPGHHIGQKAAVGAPRVKATAVYSSPAKCSA